MREGVEERGPRRSEPVQRIEITGRLDRPSLEALYLELRRLARRYGGEVREFQVEKLRGAATPDGWNA